MAGIRSMGGMIEPKTTRQKAQKGRNAMSLKITNTLTPGLQRLMRKLADTRAIEAAMGKAYMQTAQEEQAKLLLRKTPWPLQKGWFPKQRQRMPMLNMSQIGGKTIITSTIPMSSWTGEKAQKAALNAGTQYMASIIKRP